MARTKTTRTSNGEGTIYFDEKKKVWIGQIRWVDSAGTKRQKSFSGKKRVAVKAKMDDFKKQLIIQPSTIENKSVTFKDYCEKWMSTKQIFKLKPSSYDRKVCTLENQVYPVIGDISIEDLSHDDVQSMVRLLHDSELSYSSIKKAVEAISGCMKAYRIETKSNNNPCEGVELPQSAKRQSGDIKFFNESDRKKICAVADEKYSNGKYIYRLGHLIPLLMYTGMRSGELQALEWADVDLKNKTINICKNSVLVRDRSKDAKTKYKLVNQSSTKTVTGRIIPIPEVALQSLLKIKEVTGGQKYVASTQSGEQISLRNLQRMFAQMLERAGVEHPCKNTNDDDETETSSAGVHILRHTFASMLFQNGCDVKVVSEILGHSNTKTTENIYIHLIQEQKVKAIQSIDKFTD